MLSPINERGPSSAAIQASLDTNRERVERALAALPTRDATHSDSRARHPLAHDSLVRAVQEVNGVLNSFGVHFELNREFERMVISVIDTATGETIRQIPPEEILRAAEHLDEVRGRLLERLV